MAQQIKSPGPAPVAPHTNGTPVVPRAPVGKPEKRRSSGWGWILVVLILVAGAAAGVYWFYFMPKAQTANATAATGKHGKGGASDKIRIVPATATKGDIGVYLVGLGAVTALNTDTIQSRVNGQLMKVDFTEGQTVREGDPLLQIDTRPYEAQLAQYVAQKEHDQALLDNANIDLQRYQTLWKQDSIPQQTLATQESLVKQDQGTVDSDQALIVATQLNITYCNITAPISGRVGLRLVDVGNYVQSTSGTGLLVITQVQPITVIFTIAEDDVPAVMAKLNTGEKLTVEAWDRKNKTKLATGTLLTSDNQIDPTTGTLKLKAIFENTDNALFPNQFVNAHLLVETKKDVVLVPVAAIQYGTQGTFVYVVNDDDPRNATVSMKKVVAGTTSVDGNTIEVTSGLDEGDVVVIDGVDKLQDGSKVIVPQEGDAGKKEGGTTADGASGG
ncbi:MAG TPA: MdtA/MuxA family multidrug efflux RND transporter periplasmic adaptor subunit [Candidatus Methylacidiphilales bacterium]|jgi:multidrug efflux system membrane fusion protein|nr:MdtA/MuxA family multidrug efflux RND transporter periplasmic adaptor subunit [Candidatus Methylacidiphilales bacterium]